MKSFPQTQYFLIPISYRFQNIDYVGSNKLCLKYQRFKPPDCKDIGIYLQDQICNCLRQKCSYQYSFIILSTYKI